MQYVNKLLMSASKLRFFSKLQHTAHVVKKAADRELMAAAGITTAQAAVLTVVAAQTDATQKHVAAALGLNESAVVAMVDRLMKQGALVRVRSGTDKRAWVLTLSTEGRGLLARAAAPFAAINARIDSVVSGAELDRVTQALVRLQDEFS